MPKLIVIRGPSGAGKSTIAARLFEVLERPAALVDLDHYRFTLRNQPPGARLEYRLAESAIALALSRDSDVIFEGNFRATDDGGPPLSLSFEGAATFAFYLDVSLEETLRRHRTRADQRITAERMIELYPAGRPIEVLHEMVLFEHLTVDEAVATIRKASDL